MADSGIGTSLGGLSFSATVDTSEFQASINQMVASIQEASAKILATDLTINTDGSVRSIEQLKTTLASLQVAQSQAFDEETLIKYDLKIDQVRAAIQSLEAPMQTVAAEAKEIGTGLESSHLAASTFRGKLVALGETFIAFFAIQKIIELGVEIGKLVPIVQGVDNAFRQAGQSEQALTSLRSQTQGLISDLDLEKAAVKFADFNLPASQLGPILAFASQRARDLGLSVDEVVGKIVTGLGSSSNRAFVQLGISTQDFKAALAQAPDRVSALALVINNQLGGESKHHIDSLGESVVQLGVKFQNALKVIAESLNETFAPANSAPKALTDSYFTQYENQYKNQIQNFKKLTAEQRSALLDTLKLQQEQASAQAEALQKQNLSSNQLVGSSTGSALSGVSVSGRVDQGQLQATNARLEALRAITKELTSQNSALNESDRLHKGINITLTELEAKEKALRDDAENQVIGTVAGKKKIASDNAQADAIQKQIDDINGTNAEKARTAQDARDKQAATKATQEYNKALADTAKIQAQLNDIQKQDTAGELTASQQKILDINAKYDQLIKDIKSDSRVTGQNNSASINQANTLRESEINNVTFLDQQKAAIDAYKQRIKDQEDADQTYLNDRRDLYQAEQNFEDQFGIAAVKAAYGVQTSAYQDYLNDLKDRLATQKTAAEAPNASQADIQAYKNTIDAKEKLDTDYADRVKYDTAKAEQDNQTLEDKLTAIHAKGVKERELIDADATKTAGQRTELLQNSLDKEKSDSKDAISADLANKLGGVLTAIQLVNEAFAEMGGIIQNLGPQAQETLKKVQGAVNGIGNVLKSIVSQNYIGAIISLVILAVTAIVNVFTRISKSKKDTDNAIAAANKQAIDGLYEYNQVKLQGEEATAAADQAHLDSIQKAIDLTSQSTDIATQGADSLKKQVENVPIITAHNRKFSWKTGKYFDSQTTDSTTHTDDQLQQALDQGTIQGAQNIKNVQEYLKYQKQVTDNAKQQLDLEKQKDALLLGQTTDAIEQGLNKAVTNSLTTFENFGTDITNILRQSVIAGFDQSYLDPVIKQFQTELINDLKADPDGILTAQQVTSLNAYKAKFQQQSAQLAQILNQVGIAPATGTTASVSQAFTGITQDTAELLAGRFNALGLTAINQLNVATDSLTQLQAINQNTYNTFQTLDYISQVMLKSGQVDQSVNNKLRAGGTFF